MSKNTRTLSHLSTSFNTVSMHPDDNVKSMVSIFGENQRNIDQMMIFKGELLALHERFSRMKIQNQQTNVKLRSEIEVEREKVEELQDRNNQLSLSIKQLLIGKLEYETIIKEVKNMLESSNGQLAKCKDSLQEKIDQVIQAHLDLKQLTIKYDNNEASRQVMNQKIKDLVTKLSNYQTQVFEMKNQLHKAKNQNSLITSQMRDFLEENQKLKRELQKIRTQAGHKQYKVDLLQQTLSGGLGDLKNLEDKARKQLQNEIVRLKELLSSYEKINENKDDEILSIRSQNKNRIGSLMQQVAVLHELNRKLQLQNHGTKAQIELIRTQNQSRISQKVIVIKQLESQNLNFRSQVQKVMKLFKNSRDALQKKQTEVERLVEKNQKQRKGYEERVISYEKELQQLQLNFKTKQQELIQSNILLKEEVLIYQKQYMSKMQQLIEDGKEQLERSLSIQRQKYQRLKTSQKECLNLINVRENQILKLQQKHKAEILLLREQGNLIRSHKEETEDMFRHTKEEMNTLLQQLRQKNNQIKIINEQYDTLKLQLQNANQYNNQLEKKLYTLNEQLTFCDKRFTEAEQSLKNTIKDLQKLKQTECQLQLLQQKLNKNKQLHLEQVRRLKVDNSSLNMEINVLKQSIKCVQNYSKDLQKSNTSLQKELAQLKIKRLRANEQSLNQMMDQLNQSQIQISRLSSENTALAEKLDIMYRQRSKSQESVNSYCQSKMDQITLLQSGIQTSQKQLRSEQIKCNRYRQQSIVQCREIQLLESKLLAKEQIIQSIQIQRSNFKLQNQKQKAELYFILNKKVKQIQKLKEELRFKGCGLNMTSRESLGRSQQTLTYSLRSDKTFEELTKNQIKIEVQGETDENKYGLFNI